MNTEPKKRSPRAPSLSLSDALDRALVLYSKEGRHAVPMQVVAQDLGYKDASNGAAKTVIATLRQYGLVQTPKEGFLAIAKEVEEYKFSPDENSKQALKITWAQTPKVFADLIGKYPEHLPSDGTIRFDLIKMGFLQGSVEDCVSIFKKTIDFSNIYAIKTMGSPAEDLDECEEPLSVPQHGSDKVAPPIKTAIPQSPAVVAPSTTMDSLPPGVERIPIRLKGGRRAFLEVPTPLYEADKTVIKTFLDAVITDDEELA